MTFEKLDVVLDNKVPVIPNGPHASKVSTDRDHFILRVDLTCQAGWPDDDKVRECLVKLLHYWAQEIEKTGNMELVIDFRAFALATSEVVKKEDE